jgi:hypothetical protein
MDRYYDLSLKALTYGRYLSGVHCWFAPQGGACATVPGLADAAFCRAGQRARRPSQRQATPSPCTNRSELKRALARKRDRSVLSSLSHITKIFGLDYQAAIHIYGDLTYHGDKK